MAQTYDLIASATADGSSGTIQFDSIPQTYSNLHFFLSIRSTTTTASTQTELKVTPQTSSAWSASLAAYFINYVSAQDASNYSSSTGTDNINLIVRVPNSSSSNFGSTAQYFGCYRIDFPEYSRDGINKGFYMYGGTITDATYFASSSQANGNLRVVAPFVQMTFALDNGNFVSGSRIRMYGTSNS